MSSGSSDHSLNDLKEDDPYYLEMKQKFYGHRVDFTKVTKNCVTFRQQPSMKYFLKFDKIGEIQKRKEQNFQEKRKKRVFLTNKDVYIK